MLTTGNTVPVSGIYSGICNNHHVKEISVSVGEKLPPCNTGSCSGSVKYRLVRATR